MDTKSVYGKGTGRTKTDIENGHEKIFGFSHYRLKKYCRNTKYILSKATRLDFNFKRTVNNFTV